ncbi:MAG: polyprenyl synthetase family protein [bacterium]
MNIKEFIKEELEEVDKYIKRLTNSNISEISAISRHLISSGGKRIRPYLVILSSMIFNVPRKQYIKIASAIELYHSATLLHDDVVDNAKRRRGTPSANDIWGNKNSILVGDFLLANSSAIIASMENQALLNLFIRVLTLMAEGELVQLRLSRDIKLTQKDYYTIIKKKTAYLISASCESGPIMANASQTERFRMRQYGLLIGIAFQLIDDNIDYMSSGKVSGKDKGVDLKEGKVTLPMIVALSNANKKEKAILKRALKSYNGDNALFNDVYAIIEKYRGFEYTKKRAEMFANKALGLLEGLPPSSELEELKRFTQTITERKA